MKKAFAIIIILAVSIILGKELLDHTVISRSMPEPNVVINKTAFTVEVANEPLEQIKGLSGHAPLQDNQAMLFIFPKKQTRNFWMKNMLFPIDILWIEDNQIVKIDKALPPEGETPEKSYSSITPVNYVLEINAGLSDKYNLRAGDKVKINL